MDFFITTFQEIQPSLYLFINYMKTNSEFNTNRVSFLRKFIKDQPFCSLTQFFSKEIILIKDYKILSKIDKSLTEAEEVATCIYSSSSIEKVFGKNLCDHPLLTEEKNSEHFIRIREFRDVLRAFNQKNLAEKKYDGIAESLFYKFYDVESNYFDALKVCNLFALEIISLFLFGDKGALEKSFYKQGWNYDYHLLASKVQQMGRFMTKGTCLIDDPENLSVVLRNWCQSELLEMAQENNDYIKNLTQDLKPEKISTEIFALILEVSGISAYCYFSLVELAFDPEFQNRYFLSDKKGRLIQSFIYEIKRFYPLAPLIPKRISNDIQITSDKKLKKGSTIIGLISDMHQDINHFGFDANKFNPARKIDQKMGHKLYNFGFGMGACAGRFFVESTLRSFIKIFLRHGPFKNIDENKTSYINPQECPPSLDLEEKKLCLDLYWHPESGLSDDLYPIQESGFSEDLYCRPESGFSEDLYCRPESGLSDDLYPIQESGFSKDLYRLPESGLSEDLYSDPESRFNL